VHLSNWKWKNSCVFGIKRTCRRERNWFELHSSNLSWVAYCIFPRWIDIPLLTITSKRLTGCEDLLRCHSYRFIVKRVALQNSSWSCKVDTCGVWLRFEWMSKPNVPDLFRHTTKALFLFPTTYRCETVFSTIWVFWNKSPIPTSTRRRHQVGVDRLLVRQTCETNSETRFSLKFVAMNRISKNWCLYHSRSLSLPWVRENLYWSENSSRLKKVEKHCYSDYLIWIRPGRSHVGKE